MYLVIVTQIILITNLILHYLYKNFMCAKSNYTEANIDEDVDLKNQYKIKKLPDPINTQDACSKKYVDILFNDPSIFKNTSRIDLND